MLVTNKFNQSLHPRIEFPKTQRFAEGETSHKLLFSVTVEDIKDFAPEVYEQYINSGVEVSIDVFDVNDDGEPEVLVYDNTPGDQDSPLDFYSIRVFGRSSNGSWAELVSQPESFLIRDYAPEMSHIAMVRSPWGDYALATGGLRSFYEWRGEHFDSLPSGYGSYEAWLKKREEEYNERISPLTFSEESFGTYKRIVSEHYRLSFEIPSTWKMHGKYIHTYMWSYLEADEPGLGASVLKAVMSTEGYDGPWGHGNPLESQVDGTQASFDSLRAQPNGFATKKESDTRISQYQKLENLTISGIPAVRVHYWGYVYNSDGGWHDEILWIKDGDTNWYITSRYFDDRLDGEYQKLVQSLQILK